MRAALLAGHEPRLPQARRGWGRAARHPARRPQGHGHRPDGTPLLRPRRRALQAHALRRGRRGAPVRPPRCPPAGRGPLRLIRSVVHLPVQDDQHEALTRVISAGCASSSRSSKRVASPGRAAYGRPTATAPDIVLNELKDAALGDRTSCAWQLPWKNGLDGPQLRALALSSTPPVRGSEPLGRARHRSARACRYCSQVGALLRGVHVRRVDLAGVRARGTAGAGAVHGAGAGRVAADRRRRAGALADDGSRELVAHPLPARWLLRQRGRARLGRGGLGTASRQRTGGGRRHFDRRRRHRTRVAPRGQGRRRCESAARPHRRGRRRRLHARQGRHRRRRLHERRVQVCRRPSRARRSPRRISVPRRCEVRQPLGGDLRPGIDRGRPHAAAPFPTAASASTAPALVAPSSVPVPHLESDADYSLSFRRAEVGDQVNLGRDFHGGGPLLLDNARIGGDLNGTNSTLKSRLEGDALTAVGTEIGGSVVLTNLSAVGTVFFMNSQIGGSFSAIDAKIANLPEPAVIRVCPCQELDRARPPPEQGPGANSPHPGRRRRRGDPLVFWPRRAGHLRCISSRRRSKAR